MPTGSVPAHIPSTMMEIGTVAYALSGANIAPTIPPVETITVLLPPASACAIASTSALRRARRSPAAASRIGSATADIIHAPKTGAGKRRVRFLSSSAALSYCRRRRSELQRTGMTDHHVAYLVERAHAHLAERGAHFRDQKID